MMLLECPLLVSPILDSLLAVDIRIYTIVEVQATLLVFELVFFSQIGSISCFLLSYNKKLVYKYVHIMCDAHDFLGYRVH